MRTDVLAMQKVVQWYPGHMTKARRMLEQYLRLVDVMIELVDARVPWSSRNPDIDALLGAKPRIVALTKVDLADPHCTESWRRRIAGGSVKSVVLVDALRGTGVKEVFDACRAAAAARLEFEAGKGRRPRPIRVMVAGVPNVGKSSLINRMVQKGSARVGNKPGVTRGPQWVRVRDDVELLDTPGLLWPKFEDQIVGIRLALTGAISMDVVDRNGIARHLLAFLALRDRDVLSRRYKLCGPLPALDDDNSDEGASLSDAEYDQILAALALSRGYLSLGGVADLEKAVDTLLADFRDGHLGRFSLDPVL